MLGKWGRGAINKSWVNGGGGGGGNKEMLGKWRGGGQ